MQSPALREIPTNPGFDAPVPRWQAMRPCPSTDCLCQVIHCCPPFFANKDGPVSTEELLRGCIRSQVHCEMRFRLRKSRRLSNRLEHRRETIRRRSLVHGLNVRLAGEDTKQDRRFVRFISSFVTLLGLSNAKRALSAAACLLVRFHDALACPSIRKVVGDLFLEAQEECVVLGACLLGFGMQWRRW